MNSRLPFISAFVLGCLLMTVFESSAQTTECIKNITLNHPSDQEPIEIRWKKDRTAAQYEIRRRKNSDQKWRVLKSAIPGDAVSFIDWRMSSGTDYIYRLIRHEAGGDTCSVYLSTEKGTVIEGVSKALETKNPASSDETIAPEVQPASAEETLVDPLTGDSKKDESESEPDTEPVQVVDETVLSNSTEESQVLSEKSFSIGGHIHTAFYTNLNNPLSRENSVFGVYDKRFNQFQLGMTQISMAYTNKNTEAILDLNFGPGSETVNGNSVGGSSNLIQNAYISYSPGEKISIQAGKFGTFIGYEVIDATANSQYTYSYLFNYGPFSHLGVKVNYALSSKIGLMATLVNNWDDLIDNNRSFSYGGSLYYQPFNRVEAYLNWLGGNEADESDEKAFRSMFDLVVNYQISDGVKLGLNGAYGAQEVNNESGSTTENWGGIAGYLDFSVARRFGLSLRGEYFNDAAEVRGLEGKVIAGTISGNVRLANESLNIRPELRYDFSSRNRFEDDRGQISLDNQLILGIAILYNFQHSFF